MIKRKILFMIGAILLVLSGCGKGADEREAFFLGDNLKTAITQLALSYDAFDRNSVESEYWREIFVSGFIQNTRLSFDYLDRIAEENQGEIDAAELNYIQYSLTGIEIDFSSYEGGSVNRYDAASALNYGSISAYDYEDTDDGVIVTADLEVGYDGTATVRKYKVTAELVRNPDSCFDGYNVVSVSSEAVPVRIGQEGSTYTFYGTDMMFEDDGVFPFEFLYAEEDLSYGHFVYVDMTKLPELADLVRQNAGSTFKVTFILSGEVFDAVTTVVPTEIALVE
ncbi:MAG: hypothetical protein NC417_14025 [Candidatus Gastranaerophilales bacterium]|nr:hypothetical protein [Candidatus Gastranaerophilales bacterium]